MTDRELPWPKPGTKAFAPPPDGERKFVFLDWPPYSHDPSYYADAFKLGADAVVRAAEQGAEHPDRYFYTAGFLYRHFIELSLKQCIQIGSELHEDAQREPFGHNLQALWKDARRYIKLTWPEGPTEDLDAAEQIILEFDQVDHTNEEFRYPVTRDGRASLANAPRHLDLNNLKSRMDEMSSFFMGAMLGMDHELEVKRDYEAYLRGHMPRGDVGY